MKQTKNLRALVAIPLLFIFGHLFISCGDGDDIFDDEFIFPVDVTPSDSDSTVTPTPKEPIRFSELKVGEATDVVYSARNFIIEETERDGRRFLRISKDLGNTWKEFENTYGDLVYFHIFSTGDMLFATMNWCYYIDKDLTAIYPSQVFDYNGNVFQPIAKEYFFQVGDCKNHIWKIDETEIIVWGDYNATTWDANYVSRVWYSADYGKTVKCAINFNETKIDGKIQRCRHTHGVRFDKFDKVFYVMTGDFTSQCQLIKGTYNPQNDEWNFERLGSGNNYKFTSIYFDKEYAYLVTDYTASTIISGILKCRKDSLFDISKFEYVYKNDENRALQCCEFDMNGNHVLMPDGTGKTFIYYAKGNYDFKKIPLSKSGYIIGFTSPNYNGDVYARIDTYPFNIYHNFNFTESMRNSGVIDYMRFREPKSLYFDEDFFFNYQYE